MLWKFSLLNSFNKQNFENFQLNSQDDFWFEKKYLGVYVVTEKSVKVNVLTIRHKCYATNQNMLVTDCI